MLKVFYTVDVEIWCDGWRNIDQRFPNAFQQYVYGKTTKGEFGLRYQLQRLREHGLTGVFFVEPLFALRFGLQPLAEIVGLVKEYGHEVQLHMHPEWVDEAREAVLPKVNAKKQFMRQFSLEEQTILIGRGIELIDQAGGGRVNAFRAGSFGCNRDTLIAAQRNQIQFDSSYNASMMGLDSGILPEHILSEPVSTEGLIEYPMTVFNDGTGVLRHTQLGACSSWELEGLMWQAAEQKRTSFVILSHNFELLNRARTGADLTAIKRFDILCQFLQRHNDVFHVTGFQNLHPVMPDKQSTPLRSPLWKTLHRVGQQAFRRRFG